ncbi:hypothetical protein [Dactylosporangium salmoneum]|uniref:EfeO-type cupredoxin-like domain-containing protein n=1 Tax=Dactylosporangium salmoneum TaxID=53361 RepID=A0ABP5S847_9ACTN
MPSKRDVWYRAIAVVVVALAAVVAIVFVSSGGDKGGTDAVPVADVGSGPVDREFAITITNRAATPPTSRVEIPMGSTIRITVTSDVADELHVHGYDRKAVLTPGVPASVAFRAGTAGLFEVETHVSDLVLMQLVVR